MINKMRPDPTASELREERRIRSHVYGEAVEKSRLASRHTGYPTQSATVLGGPDLTSAPPASPAYQAPTSELRYRTDVAAVLSEEAAAARAEEAAVLAAKQAAKEARNAQFRANAAARMGVERVESVGEVLHWGLPPPAQVTPSAPIAEGSTPVINHNAPGLAYDIVGERYLVEEDGDGLKNADAVARQRWQKRAQALAARDSSFDPITGREHAPVIDLQEAAEQHRAKRESIARQQWQRRR